VDSSNLTPEQAARLQQAIREQLDYLNRLCTRMQQQRWPNEDPVCRDALAARLAIQQLHTSCKGAGPKPPAL
jgi:hypothetical protein